ncbi:iron-containing alcohol dehydrogenase family protein [Alkalicoccus saliphilus]|uniref:Glycerol dehydrogenase n=1 Tax=Alkalicoccus saliphilus TaxID=200989 RepID=A0A2T4U536_9BACI|nr:iron-containing alcohol dehydrogenase family protein [Alkalicoccus saliphilus]PTL38504.1 glycerol dehydrogenase [Alkalicoccus saliphilus]
MTSPITNIPIPAVLEISAGSLYRLEPVFERHGFKKVLFLFDKFTYEELSEKVLQSFSGVKAQGELLDTSMDIHGLIKKAFSMETYDAVTAVGGGAVIDQGKYIAFSRAIPFISMPTSASNDGFASSNSSLIVDGKKTTVPAKVPYGIVADLDIIQRAPKKFILAGIGDLMSNITALYDWDFEDRRGVSQVNAFAAMLSKKAVNSFIRTPMGDITHPTFLKELVSSLTMGGVATVISGSSAPISGSEHLISHALDKHAEHKEMHGIQIGISTYIMAHVQNHRAERMHKVFSRTGFFDYVQSLHLTKDDFRQAIKRSPDMKPHRWTYLHEETYRTRALEFLESDPMLQQILK